MLGSTIIRRLNIHTQYPVRTTCIRYDAAILVAAARSLVNLDRAAFLLKLAFVQFTAERAFRYDLRATARRQAATNKMA